MTGRVVRVARFDRARVSADPDLHEAQSRIDAAFDRIRRHLARGGTIAGPADGVGTGRARLAERAPAVAHYIALRVHALLEASDPTP